MAFVMEQFGKIAGKINALIEDNDVTFVCVQAEYENGPSLYFDVDTYGLEGVPYAFGGVVGADTEEFSADVKGLWISSVRGQLDVCDDDCNRYFSMSAMGMKKLRISANVLPWGEYSFVFSGYDEELEQYAREIEYETQTGDYA